MRSERVARRLARTLLERRARPISDSALAGSALVFAPHPDDETLGCGGTIAVKRRRGARVRVVFMTDGAASHADFVGAADLRARRMQEAHAALEVLGVEPSDRIFLGYPDGNLLGKRADALGRVRELLRESRPGSVLVPYRGEGPADHAVTHEIVAAAVAREGIRVTLLEYPVWFWHHWPWVPLGRRSRGELRGSAKQAWNARAGLRLIRDFSLKVPIAEALETKRRALAEHRSQMQAQHSDWPTLTAVSDGEFLECFFQEHEFFRESAPGPASRAREGANEP